MPSLTVSLPSLSEFHEGQYVYLYPDVNHTPQCSSQPLTFSASRLPNGLSLDTSTGLINGVLPHSLANRTNPTREYTITLTATDGIDTASASATVRIHNTDYTLLSPGDQSNTEGDYVYLDLQSLWSSAYAGLNMQAPLIFSTPSTSAPNSLPPGLSLDANTDIISGTISSDAATPNNSPYSYYVTITLQNLADGDTSTIAFNWVITDNPNPGEPPAGTGTEPPPGTGNDPPPQTEPPPDPSNDPPPQTEPPPDPGNDPPPQTEPPPDPGNEPPPQTEPPPDPGNDPPPQTEPPPDPGNDPPPQTEPPPDPGNDPPPQTEPPPDPGNDPPPQTEPPPDPGNDPPPDDHNDPVQLYNAEGDYVSVYLGPLVDDQGHRLSYTVTGQPKGVDLVYISEAGNPDGTEGNVSTSPGVYLQGIVAYSNVPSNQPPRHFQVAVMVAASSSPPQENSYTFTWTIADKARMGDIPSRQNNEGDFVFWLPEIASAPGEEYTITYHGLPAGLDYFTKSGLVYGYVSYANVSTNAEPVTYEVTIAVDDGTSVESQVFLWTVSDTNRIRVIQDQSNQEGDKVQLIVEADDATGAQLSFSAEGLPRGLKIDTYTGMISGILSYRNVDGDAGESVFDVRIELSDGESWDVRTFRWTVSERDWWANPPHITSQEGEEIYIELPFQNNSGQPIEYAFRNVPAGIVWDATNYALRGIVAYRNVLAPQPETTYTVEVARIPDPERGVFQWTVRDEHRILIEEATLVETVVGEEVDVTIPTLPRDDAEWTFEAENLPAGLMLDSDTGRISGTVADPRELPGAAGTYQDYSELGYVEYHVTLRVRDFASVDERHLLWRVFIPPNNVLSEDPIWDTRSVINKILSEVGSYIRFANNNTAAPQTNTEIVQLKALALVDRFHNTHIVAGALKLFKDLQQIATEPIKQLILESKGLEAIKRIVETKERIEQAGEVFKFLWEFWHRKDVKLYRQTFENEQGSYVTVVLAYRPTDGYVNVGYFGKVKFKDPDNGQEREEQFAFYVTAKVIKKTKWRGLVYSYEVEDKKLNWLVPR
uniref:Type VI secretion system Vgr family protein n=1 Tax=uncultured Planctomycetota bacterium TaxID=120965 RepID=H5SCB4_9BACT|nr:type VI secretion system Vgr family protein [uncultured Planctomycetota bacterium]